METGAAVTEGSFGMNVQCLPNMTYIWCLLFSGSSAGAVDPNTYWWPLQDGISGQLNFMHDYARFFFKASTFRELRGSVILSLCHTLPQSLSYKWISKVSQDSQKEVYISFLNRKSSKSLWRFIFYLIIMFLLCAGWGYTVAFTSVLTIYQIYDTWIHPLHHSPLSSLPHSWNSFNRFHFPIYTHVYTIFTLYSHSHAFYPTLIPPPTGTNTPDRTCSTLLGMF
jgi:hypothetical protein